MSFSQNKFKIMDILWVTFEHCSNVTPQRNVQIYPTCKHEEGIITEDIPIPQGKGHNGI